MRTIAGWWGPASILGLKIPPDNLHERGVRDLFHRGALGFVGWHVRIDERRMHALVTVELFNVPQELLDVPLDIRADAVRSHDIPVRCLRLDDHGRPVIDLHNEVRPPTPAGGGLEFHLS